MANLKNVPAIVAPAVSNASAVVVKPVVVKKISRAIAEAMVASGDITKEMLEKWVKAGRVTSGEGGGEDIFTQLSSGGISAELIAKTKSVLAEVNAVLWKDAKTYIGVCPKHKFSFDHEDKTYSYEAPAEIEFAAWVKHFDPSQKVNRAAAIAKK